MNHYKNSYKLCQKFTYSAPKHLPAVFDATARLTRCGTSQWECLCATHTTNVD